MPKNKATSVAAYLRELPAERRKAISAVRDFVLRHLPTGVEETINWGMISYEIPLARYPTTYNKQPLAFAALAAQKNYNALYLMCAYDKKRAKILRDAFKRERKKLDMGKSCIRFKSPDDLALDAIGEVIASITVEEWIAVAEASRKKK